MWHVHCEAGPSATGQMREASGRCDVTSEVKASLTQRRVMLLTKACWALTARAQEWESPCAVAWDTDPWLVGSRSERHTRVPPGCARVTPRQPPSRQVLHSGIITQALDCTFPNNHLSHPHPPCLGSPFGIFSSFHHPLRPHPKEGYGLCVLCPDLLQCFSSTHGSSPTNTLGITIFPQNSWDSLCLSLSCVFYVDCLL